MTDTQEQDDIVVELRRWASAHGWPRIKISKTGQALADGADEIEKLRGLLAEVVGCIDADDYLRLTMLLPKLIDKYYPEGDDSGS
jgi:hypothetical protein